MRNKIFGFILVAAAILAIPTARAEESHLVANIPFAFTVNNHTLPAGKYQIVCDSPVPAAVTLESTDGQHSIMALANSMEQTGEEMKGQLVFQRYGDHYFLSEVLSPGLTFGKELSPSKAQREVQREMASKGLEPSTVEVAAVRQ